MPRFPVRRLRGHLAAADAANSNAARGRAFEDYLSVLFGAVPGIEIVERNTLNAFRTEELDIALWNNGHVRGLRFLPNLLLVECKNWNSPVGSAELNYFASRLRQRGCDYGFLIAARGITGDPQGLTAAHFQLATALADGIRIVVLTRGELEAIPSTADLCTLVKRKLCQLIASGTAA
jgi:hypothetical protein